MGHLRGPFFLCIRRTRLTDKYFLSALTVADANEWLPQATSNWPCDAGLPAREPIYNYE